MTLFLGCLIYLVGVASGLAFAPRDNPRPPRSYMPMGMGPKEFERWMMTGKLPGEDDRP